MDSMFKTIAFESGNELSIMAGMMSFIVLEIVFFLVLMGVGIYFIVEAVRNEAFTTNEKVMWSLMIFFFQSYSHGGILVLVYVAGAYK